MQGGIIKMLHLNKIKVGLMIDYPMMTTTIKDDILIVHHPSYSYKVTVENVFKMYRIAVIDSFTDETIYYAYVTYDRVLYAVHLIDTFFKYAMLIQCMSAYSEKLTKHSLECLVMSDNRTLVFLLDKDGNEINKVPVTVDNAHWYNSITYKDYINTDDIVIELLEGVIKC